MEAWTTPGAEEHHPLHPGRANHKWDGPPPGARAEGASELQLVSPRSRTRAPACSVLQNPVTTASPLSFIQQSLVALLPHLGKLAGPSCRLLLAISASPSYCDHTLAQKWRREAGGGGREHRPQRPLAFLGREEAPWAAGNSLTTPALLSRMGATGCLPKTEPPGGECLQGPPYRAPPPTTLLLALCSALRETRGVGTRSFPSKAGTLTSSACETTFLSETGTPRRGVREKQTGRDPSRSLWERLAAGAPSPPRAGQRWPHSASDLQAAPVLLPQG